MNATSLYFRKLFSGSRELNYGNTVLVQRDNGQWWLGYVQDIDGPNFFVDFDASSISAQWIHSSRLWPHRFIDPAQPLQLEGSPVHVALRDTHTDPMVFRQGTIADATHSSPFYVVNDDSPDGVKRQHIVHRNHCTRELPVPDDMESFFARTTGFQYTKHVISFPEAQFLPDVDFIPAFLARTCRFVLGKNSLCGAECHFDRDIWVDEIHIFCTAQHRHAGGTFSVGVGCRMFVRMGVDTVTFICAEWRGNEHSPSLFWNRVSLETACADYLNRKVTAEPIRKDTISWHVLQHDVEEMSISDLAHPILTDILLHLDGESQLRASRVCALWRLIFSNYVNHRHITLNICLMCEGEPWNGVSTPGASGQYADEFESDDYAEYLKYKMFVTLCSLIPNRTEALELIEHANHFHYDFDLTTRMTMMTTVLAAKGVRLPVVSIRNGSAIATPLGPPHDFLAVVRNDQSGVWECHGLSEVMTVCDQLVLINFTAVNFITGAALQIFTYDTVTSLPWFERAFLRRDTYNRPFQVTIPRLRFRYGEAAAEGVRILLAAANDQCPAVSQRVLDKVTAMHARWVLTLAYPDQWTEIRTFLQMFSSLRPDDAPQRWTTMDLRHLDIAALSRVTFAALDGCFED
ncbi:uncharacterized protein LOC129600301 [Paramacrobiotus metropolitanus]|uniref:uncharacterized protein LOC129600301 n=1 Tax=Paramacrobiotus metropolitanus TaxID=2943436 RepID=UPI0024458AFD|nr:uncharacterized protein LOC129600301 [Paramacrobiotus metropolitanus]